MEGIDWLGIGLTVAALMVAVIGHEIMHGYAAWRYGDDTAKNAGRLSINPIRHVDPVGTILLPGILLLVQAPFLFGWAKPVPVNTLTVIRNGGFGAMVVVDLAGIAFNFALALVAAAFLQVWSMESLVFYFMFQLLLYNVLLGVFNLLPVPPLDGSNALGHAFAALGRLEVVRFFNLIRPYGMIFLVLILVTPAADYLFALIRAIVLALMGR